jgi:hypothetical protein
MRKKPWAFLVSHTMLFSVVASGGSNQKIEGAATSISRQFVQALSRYEKL